ncbi:RDD family protein [Cellulomonas aerilata]|uniref:RDD family protein n=1 Tax=Cellulomonas aerilata TaxID=515326 RepID=A0A512DB80_9CELL|nr:RDD family protein [Cellulomonas aerilata]GEO33749.1 RDD family protein [Cellulomonas aerilata]
MAAREDMGSWLEGGPSGAPGGGRGGLALPAQGPGSLAPLGRRAVALAVDWALCLAISAGFFAGDPLVTLAVFAAENVLLVGTIGATVGHRLLGMQVRPEPPAAAPGRPAPTPADVRGAGLPGPVAAAVRTVLLCLVVPAVVWDADGRSLHDRVAGTVLVRR